MPSSTSAHPASSFCTANTKDDIQLTSLHDSSFRFRFRVIASTMQSACIQHPIPMEQLHEFLAQDVEQNQLTQEQSTLPQAVLRA